MPMMTKTTTYGQRLLAARTRAVLSTRELAKISGVGRDTIIRLEADRQQPHTITTRRLAAALGITPQALAGVEAPEGASG